MFIVYFVIGFAQDFLVARYTKCTCMGEALSAANLSFLITILSVFVLNKILIEKNLIAAIMYLGGIWLGTFVATKLNK